MVFSFFDLNFPFIYTLVLHLFSIHNLTQQNPNLAYNLLYLCHLGPYLAIYQFTLAYLIQIPGFSIFMFAFKLRKIQIIPTKYPKHVIKLLRHILGYYSSDLFGCQYECSNVFTCDEWLCEVAITWLACVCVSLLDHRMPC